MPPPRRGIAMGRAYAIAMASLAEDVGTRAFCDRIIPGQQDGSRRYHVIQQKGQPQAGKLPCRPASLRQHPRRGGDMSRGVMAHGPSDVGDGLAASRHDGPEPQRQEPGRRWGGNR